MGYKINYSGDSLMHYGVKGMKWVVVNERLTTGTTRSNTAYSNPRSENKKVTGQAKPVYKRGSGLGTGPVGRSDAYRNKFTQMLSTNQSSRLNEEEFIQYYNATKNMSSKEAYDYIKKQSGSESLAKAFSLDKTAQNDLNQLKSYLQANEYDKYFSGTEELAQWCDQYYYSIQNDEPFVVYDSNGNAHTLEDVANANPGTINIDERTKKQAEIIHDSYWLTNNYYVTVAQEAEAIKQYRRENGADTNDNGNSGAVQTSTSINVYSQDDYEPPKTKRDARNQKTAEQYTKLRNESRAGKEAAYDVEKASRDMGRAQSHEAAYKVNYKPTSTPSSVKTFASGAYNQGAKKYTDAYKKAEENLDNAKFKKALYDASTKRTADKIASGNKDLSIGLIKVETKAVTAVNNILSGLKSKKEDKNAKKGK